MSRVSTHSIKIRTPITKSVIGSTPTMLMKGVKQNVQKAKDGCKDSNRTFKK